MEPKTAEARPPALSPSPVPWFPRPPQLPHLSPPLSSFAIISLERASSFVERREARGHPAVAARGMTASRECMSSCGGLVGV